MPDLLFLAAAGCLAGAMNALAGGGSFVSLPALTSIGVPPLLANSYSSVALWPGGLASAWTYRKDLQEVCGVPLGPTIVWTLVGGFIGATLLLSTSPLVFDHILPWLLLIATITLAGGRRLGPLLRSRFRAGPRTVLPLQLTLGVLPLQLTLGVYAGYFGGAVGLMMVAAWSLLDGVEVKQLNPFRTTLVSASNAVAVIVFTVAGAVSWRETSLLAAGALIGGYAGALLGRVAPPALVRLATVSFAALGHGPLLQQALSLTRNEHGAA